MTQALLNQTIGETILLPRLSDDERTRLTQLTTDIRDGLNLAEKAYSLIAPAIYEVYTRVLYREYYASIDEWADAEFGITSRTLYHYIDHYQIGQQVTANGTNGLPTPDAVRHTRALKRIPAQKRAEVWQEALSADSITTKAIEAAAERVAARDVLNVTELTTGNGRETMTLPTPSEIPSEKSVDDRDGDDAENNVTTIVTPASLTDAIDHKTEQERVLSEAMALVDGLASRMVVLDERHLAVLRKYMQTRQLC